MLNENMTLKEMAFNCAVDEMNNAYVRVFDKFERVYLRIAEVKQEIESIFDFINRIFLKRIVHGPGKKINYLDWSIAVDMIKIHAKALDLYTDSIKDELKMFQDLMHFAAENMRNNIFVINDVLETAEKVVEVFLSVHRKTELRMKDFQARRDKLKASIFTSNDTFILLPSSSGISLKIFKS